MTARIPVLLTALLDATADEQAAKARQAGIRAVLEAEGRRRVDVEGAAPTWNATGAGVVRYQDVGAWSATVSDPQAFASFVAEHHPEHVTATILLNAADLAEALQALEFTGVKPLRSELEVRDPFGTAYLKGLTVDVEEAPRQDDGAIVRTFTVTDVDEDTGTVLDVPGVTGARTAGKLVVALDKARKAAALEAATAAAQEVIAAATADEPDAATPDAAVVKDLRARVEALHADVVKSIAKALDLSQTGTKPELANRIAIMAAANSGAAAVLHAMAAKAAEEDAAHPAILVEVPRLDPNDPELGAKAIARAEALKDELHERRQRAEARTSAETFEDELDAHIAESMQDPEYAAATARPLAELGDPAPAAVASEAPAVAAGDDDPAVLALEAAGNREQLRAVARANNLPAGGTKRDVALVLARAAITEI